MPPTQTLLKKLKASDKRVSLLLEENACRSARVSELEKKLEAAHAQIEQYKSLVDQLLKHKFGAKSERYVDENDPQLSLFDEPKPEASNDEDFDDSDENNTDGYSEGKSKKKNKRRIRYPEDLKRTVVDIDVPSHMQTCQCGKHMPIVGYDVREILNYIPESFSITEEHHLKRGCACKQGMIKAKAPSRTLPGVLIGNELLAQIIVSKCLDRQPNYHLAKRWEARHGVVIPRDSMSRWMIQLADRLQPLYNLLQDKISDYDIAWLDATWIQVLKEEGRLPQTKSKAWCIIGGPPETPVTLYEYCAKDHTSFLLNQLSEFKGTVHGDADPCYQQFHAHKIVMSYCNAHSRRHYVPIAQSTEKKGISHYVMHAYKKLYLIEQNVKDLKPEQKQAKRQQLSKPILDELKAYLLKHYNHIPPKSNLRKAVDYTLKYWDGLTEYLNDGRLSIDNNLTERQIRQFVMTRNNFLFADTVKGAKALCLHFSLIQTAIQNGLEPYQYYVDVLNKIAHCNEVGDYEQLLPWSTNIAESRAA